jgi:hypothetical protein
MFCSALFLLFLYLFHLISDVDLQNIFSRNTSGTRSIVYAYVSKFAYFSYIGLKLVVLNMR